jgi:hypothetical protein
VDDVNWNPAPLRTLFCTKEEENLPLSGKVLDLPRGNVRLAMICHGSFVSMVAFLWLRIGHDSYKLEDKTMLPGFVSSRRRSLRQGY